MRIVITLLTGLLLSTSAWGLDVSQPFSATAVQQVPGQAERQARIFVTADRVRMEYPAAEGGRVEITDMKAGRAYVLLPQQRVFAQKAAAPAVMSQMQQASRPASPCVMPSEAVCNKLGEEVMFGRPAQKWEMIVEHQGKSYRSLYWIDKERFMPLRQVWADGTVTELRPVGNERRGARDTEKWQLVTQSANGQQFSAEQWFDTQLQIMIAETISGGYRRELRDIRVGTQDPALFVVPAGYREVSAEALMPTQQQPAPQRMR